MTKNRSRQYWMVLAVSSVLAAGVLVFEQRALAGEGEHTAAEKPQEAEPPVASAPAAPTTPANQYCMNVREAAESAQIAKERNNLLKAQHEIDERITVLTAKTAEYQQWLKKRDDFLKQANDGLVEIYLKIKPDAAAAQMMVMNEEVAASIISKMPPKAASAILGEMDAARAVRLSSYLAAAGEITAGRAPSDERK